MNWESCGKTAGPSEKADRAARGKSQGFESFASLRYMPMGTLPVMT
jgi:hypothetical protein